MADPFKITSMDQLLAILDGGNFHTEVMDGMRDALAALVDHQAEFGGKPKAEMTMKINFQRQKSGDLQILGECTFKKPKAPAASGAAFIGDDLNLTLESPMLAKMRSPVRDTTESDTKTIRAAE
ncbi:hypothetical protein [Roseovarius sp. MMSF_3281]|uniref:hypothetical protein n=1 Tax=Roseovarius sp. MMSF_3281 TaxID=3046694 RepID=UPI00273E9BB8|nr:hypothetical protein [Roseovarius sp. MMSF_3281]